MTRTWSYTGRIQPRRRRSSGGKALVPSTTRCASTEPEPVVTSMPPGAAAMPDTAVPSCTWTPRASAEARSPQQSLRRVEGAAAGAHAQRAEVGR